MNTNINNVYEVVLAIPFNLQRFAGVTFDQNNLSAGGATGAGGTVTPAYSNDQTMYTRSEGLEAEFQQAIEVDFLDGHKANLPFEQFAETYSVPLNAGTLTGTIYVVDHLDPIEIPLTEGKAPNPHAVNIRAKTIQLEQFADWARITDVADKVSLHRILSITAGKHKYQSAQTKTRLTRNALMADTSARYASAVTRNVEGKPTAETEVLSIADMTKDCTLSVKEVQKVVQWLRGNNIEPLPGGDYAMMIHPDTEFDLSRDPEYTAMHQYTDTKPLFQGEIGKIRGMRFISSTEAVRVTQNKDSGKVDTYGPVGLKLYHHLAFGAKAFGMLKLGETDVEYIMKGFGSAGTADPLNQVATAGWKFFTGAGSADELAMCDLITAASNPIGALN
jgi:N4-gp56 family major capsid protein